MPDPDEEPINESEEEGGTSPIRSGGYTPMKAKPDAEQYEPSEAMKKKKLPKKADLRKYMTKVEDQGQTSSCVANAVAGAYEYGVKRVLGQADDVSRLFVYYNARWRGKSQAEDSGCQIQYAIESLQRFGSCFEKKWPFKKPLLLKKPNRTSYQEAAAGKVSMTKQIPLKLEAWKSALAEGFPIVFGCALFSSFDECSAKGGVVEMPSPDEAGRDSHGLHAMLCVGYSDVEKVFIIRNSWGEGWGDKGYCYMPYDYLMNPKFNMCDSWIFTPPAELDPNRKKDPKPPKPKPTPKPKPHHDPHNRKTRPAPPLPPVPYHALPLVEDFWYYDDAPVVNSGLGVDFVIAVYEISLYESLEIDFFEEYLVEWSSEVDEEYAEYSEYVAEESFESIEEYSIQSVAQEYTRETGETNFSTGSALTMVGGVVAAVVAENLLNPSDDTPPVTGGGTPDDALDDTALVDTGDPLDDDTATTDDEEADDVEDVADVDDDESTDDEPDDEEGDAEEDDAEEGDDAQEEEDDAEEEGDDDAEEGDDDAEEGDDDAEEGDDAEEEESDDAEEDDAEEDDAEEEEADAEEDDAEEEADGGGGDDDGGDDEE